MPLILSSRAIHPRFPAPVISPTLSTPGVCLSVQYSLHTSYGVAQFDQKSFCLHMRVDGIGGSCLARVISGAQRSEKKVVGTTRSNVYPLDKEAEDEYQEDDREVVKLKIPVGPIRNTLEETFSFKRVLNSSSALVVKPLGIVFEAVQKCNKERVVVAELVKGSYAERASRVNQMFQGNTISTKTRGGSVILNGDVRPGDILRATTTVGVVVDLLGIRAPQRVIMLHKADGRCWDDTMAALKASFVADGPLTLVLEREC